MRTTYLGQFLHFQEPELEQIGVVLGVSELGSNLGLILAQAPDFVQEQLKIIYIKFLLIGTVRKGPAHHLALDQMTRGRSHKTILE